jgi:hypothetical protein
MRWLSYWSATRARFRFNYLHYHVTIQFGLQKEMDSTAAVNVVNIRYVVGLSRVPSHSTNSQLPS